MSRGARGLPRISAGRAPICYTSVSSTDEDSAMREVAFFCTLCGQRIASTECLYGSSFTCARCGARVAVPEKPGDVTAATPAAHPTAPDDQASTAPAPEMTVLEFAPSAKAHGGAVALGAVTVLIALIGMLWLWWTQHSPWWQLLTLSCLGAGLFLLGRAYLAVKTVRYRLTSQRLLVITGLLARTTQELELFRVKDIAVNQSLMARILGYGTITVFSTDDSSPVLVLAGIGNPLGIKELIRDHYKEARRALGLRATEFIQS